MPETDGIPGASGSGFFVQLQVCANCVPVVVVAEMIRTRPFGIQHTSFEAVEDSVWRSDLPRRERGFPVWFDNLDVAQGVSCQSGSESIEVAHLGHLAPGRRAVNGPAGHRSMDCSRHWIPDELQMVRRRVEASPQ